MKQIIPDAKDIKKRGDNTGFIAFCCILAVLTVILSFLGDHISNWFKPQPTAISKIHYSLYLISDECMNTYYKNEVTTDGLVFSLNQTPIPAECRAEYLASGTIVVKATQTDEETQNQSIEAYFKMKKVGANMMHIDKIVKEKFERHNLPRFNDDDKKLKVSTPTHQIS